MASAPKPKGHSEFSWPMRVSPEVHPSVRGPGFTNNGIVEEDEAMSGSQRKRLPLRLYRVPCAAKQLRKIIYPSLADIRVWKRLWSCKEKHGKHRPRKKEVNTIGLLTH